MRPNDATTLLRELRPAADVRPDHAGLERILLADPDAPPRTRPGVVRPVAVAGTLAVVATAAIALAPGGDERAPGILDRAAAAVSAPDSILHFRATVAGSGRTRTIESWQSTDGRQERVIFDDGALESADDQGTGTLRSYDRETDTVTSHTDPDYFDAAHGRPAGLAGGNDLTAVTTIGDLPELLRRAKAGDEDVALVGRSTIDGTPVQQVRITGSVTVLDASLDAIRARGGDPRGLPTKQVPTTRDVYLREDTALPVRVTDHGLAGTPDRTVTFQQAQRLPRNATTEQLLRLADHPGAATADEGPVR